MIYIGSICLFFGAVVLVLGWRGRVIARGQFCRKCAFDLAGLSADSPESKCPECGNQIGHASNRRSKRRKKSYLGLIAGSLILMSGVGILGFWGSGNAPLVLAKMPNSIILLLTDFEVELALDELVTRASMVPTQLTDRQFSKAIDMGLAHQSDTTVVWDWRWGEVLFHACMNNMMSTEQISEYLLNGLEFTIEIRDKARISDRETPYSLTFEDTRTNALTGGTLAYARTVGISKIGVVESESDDDSLNARPDSTRGLHINRTTGSYTHTYRGRIRFDHSDLIRAGNTVSMYLECEVMLSTLDSQEPFFIETRRFEQRVTVLGRDDDLIELVKAIDQPELIEPIHRQVQLSPIQLLKEFPEENMNPWDPILRLDGKSLSSEYDVATRVYLQLANGQEYEVGQWVKDADRSDHLSRQITWTLDPKNQDSIDEARSFFELLKELETVDVILRTDSLLAESRPKLEKVMDLNAIFRDVPIQRKEAVHHVWTSNSKNLRYIQGEQLPESDLED